MTKIRVRLSRLEDFALKVPCREACPVHTDAGNYVRAIAGGHYEDAYRLARTPNPLASVCAREYAQLPAKTAAGGARSMLP
jgi:formate dehydrogenase (NADP+) beta subunit